MNNSAHRAPAATQWFVLVCLFLCSLPAVTTRIYSSDEIQYFAYLRSLWFDGDLSFENEYQYFYDHHIARSDGFHETFLERQTETGRRINFATMGCAILWAPFYAVGSAAAHMTGAATDGYSKPYVAAVAYGSACYGFLAVILSVLSARRLGFPSIAAGAIVWIGTPLLFYMYVAPPFSHACSAFGVALFIYVWLRVRGEWSTRGLIALGAAAALMTMVREQDAFFAVGPALDFCWTAMPHPASGIRGATAAVLAFAAAFTPQATAYLLLNGHLGPHASVGHKMNWAAPHGLQVLFSTEHGFLVWTPLAWLAIAGLVVFAARERSRVAACLLLMLALQVYVGGSVESWTVAGAFGQRRFVALTAILIIGTSYVMSHLPRWRVPQRVVVSCVTVLLVYWNVALIAEFAIGLMDRQFMSPRQNAYDAFVTLPVQAPSLAYRYLFDRESFYKGSQ